MHLTNVGIYIQEVKEDEITIGFCDDLNNRSQLLLEAFEILNIYSASTFGSSPFQALTTKSEQDRQLW